MILLLLLLVSPSMAAGFKLEPLNTRDFSPLVIGFGLPSLRAARVLPPRSGRAQISFDLVSNFTQSEAAGERLLFDGETYRSAVSVAYGFGQGLEFGAELPLISHQGGFLDGFIEDWHDFFGLPQGGRGWAERNQLSYHYSRNGTDYVDLNSSATGIGDISFSAGWQLWQNQEKSSSLALRTSLKLPTGDADKLTGSGSTDLALWFTGERRLDTGNGALVLYGGGGGLVTSDGDILPDQRQNIVGLVSLGCGWQPWSRAGLQLQFDGHSPFYRETQLRELDQFSGQLAFGGSLALAEKTTVELGVVEDIIVHTTSDVVFHLAFTHFF